MPFSVKCFSEEKVVKCLQLRKESPNPVGYNT